MLKSESVRELLEGDGADDGLVQPALGQLAERPRVAEGEAPAVARHQHVAIAVADSSEADEGVSVGLRRRRSEQLGVTEGGDSPTRSRQPVALSGRRCGDPHYAAAELGPAQAPEEVGVAEGEDAPV